MLKSRKTTHAFISRRESVRETLFFHNATLFYTLFAVAHRVCDAQLGEKYLVIHLKCLFCNPCLQPSHQPLLFSVLLHLKAEECKHCVSPFPCVFSILWPVLCDLLLWVYRTFEDAAHHAGSSGVSVVSSDPSNSFQKSHYGAAEVNYGSQGFKQTDL